MPKPESDRLLTAAEVAGIFAIGKTSLYRHIKRGIIPRPIKLAENTARWSHQACMDALESLKAASATKQ